MAKNITMAQLRTDILERMDTPSGGRFSDTILDRLINTSRDKLHGILSENDDDDWLTYCVGVELKPTVADIQSVPLPSFGTAAPDWWQLTEIDAGGGAAWFPNAGSNSDAVTAPGFHHLRKVQILEGYTAESVTATQIEPIFRWTGEPRNLERVSLDGMNHNADAKGWARSLPPRYRMLGSNTLWFNRPSDVDAGFLIWYVADLLDVATSGNVNLQPCWLDWIAYDVCVRLRYRDKEDAGEFIMERQACEELIRAQSNGRDEYGPPTVRETFDGVNNMGDQEYRDYLTDGYRR